MKRGASLLTLLSCVACIVVLAIARELLPGTSANYAYVPALIAILLVGAYWFFKWIPPRAILRFFATLTILYLIIATVSGMEAFPSGTRNQAAGISPFKIDRLREYAGHCFLTPVSQRSQSSSRYAVVSFGGSDALSEGYCSGVGHIDANVHASGVYGRADASGVLTFLDPGIFPATNSSAQSYSLNVAIDFLINGWQVSHRSGLAVASSSITLSVDFDITDEKGNVVYNIFGDFWGGSQNLATGDHQLSYSIGLMPGHTYSAALMFTETASAAVSGLAGDASATGCFHFSGSCAVDPFGANDDFCPATTPTGAGPCQDLEWRSMAFSLTAV